MRARTPQLRELAQAVEAAGGTSAESGDGLVIRGLSTDAVGDAAFDDRVRPHELASAQASREEAFMELTAASVEFRNAGIPSGGSLASRRSGMTGSEREYLDPALLRSQFARVRRVATFENGVVSNGEEGVPIFVATGLKSRWTSAWPAFRDYS